jgi:hypothetical protein
MSWLCSTNWWKENASRLLVGKAQGNAHRKDNNSKMYLGKLEWHGMKWIYLSQDRGR